MPPILIVPLLKWVLGALGAAALARWAWSERNRINAELESVRNGKPSAPERAGEPTLRRDPRSGEYRV